MGQELLRWDGDHTDIKPVRESFVVDDDQDMRDILTASLMPEGFPVTSFEDGDSFLRAASSRVPLCVFLDVVMPKRSGLEILQELRARQYWTPIFLVSAREDAQMVVEAMKNGAHDYIRKPFDRLAPALRVRVLGVSASPLCASALRVGSRLVSSVPATGSEIGPVKVVATHTSSQWL